MKALLPVAGSGTRMYPLGVTTPKCLLKILNKPLVVWTLEALVANQINEVVVVISAGKFGELIRNYLEQNLKNEYPHLQPLNIQIAVQEQQLGTAHVVQVAKDFFQPGEEFVFMYGDDLYGPQNIAEIMKHQGLVVMGKKVTDPEKWGIFQADEQGNLLKVIEKPDTFVGDLANIGCMKLNTQVFELFSELKVTTRGEYELTDTLQILAERSQVKVLPTTDYWIPVGYPWHLLDASEYFLEKLQSKVEGTVEENVIIKGNVVLPKSSTIKAGCVIEGNILIGENVEIGPLSYVRGNCVIGNDCVIAFNSEIKNSILGNGTKVHAAIVCDSILGEKVYVTAGCVITNRRHDKQNVTTPVKGKMVDVGRRKFGAVLGDGVALGGGTIIYPGRKIWPNKTTLPGEVVSKDLTIET